MKLKNKSFLVLICFFITGLVVFSRSLSGQFLADDNGQIVNNPIVQSAGDILEVFRGSTFYSSGQIVGGFYKPLLTLSYLFIHSLFGMNPFYFHLVQLLLHIVNAFLLFIVFKRLLKPPTAFALSLIFLIHPINVESVSYISALQDVLFVTFGLSGLLLLLKNRTISKRKLSIAFLFLFLSLLSKETGVLFFFICIFYALFFNKKLLKGVIIYSGAIALCYCFLRFGVARVGLENNVLIPITQMTLLERFESMPAILFYYIKSFLFPLRLIAFQSWVITKISPVNFYIPILVIILLSMLWIFLGKILKTNKDNYKVFLFFSMWSLLGIALHLQVLPLDQTIADRWFYFPIIGLLGIIGIIMEKIQPFLSSRKKPLYPILLVIILFLLATRSFMRSLDWQDGLTIFSHDSRLIKNDFLLHSGYGAHLLEAGYYSQAKEELVRSIQIFPHSSFAWNNLGTTYDKLGDYSEALNAYQKAISIDNYSVARENFAILLIQHGNDDNRTKEFILTSLNSAPKSPTLWAALAIINIHLNNSAEAIEAAKNFYLNSSSSSALSLYNALIYNTPFHFSEGNRAQILFGQDEENQQ